MVENNPEADIEKILEGNSVNSVNLYLDFAITVHPPAARYFRLTFDRLVCKDVGFDALSRRDVGKRWFVRNKSFDREGTDEKINAAAGPRRT